jgi:hypothetical protein
VGSLGRRVSIIKRAACADHVICGANERHSFPRHAAALAEGVRFSLLDFIVLSKPKTAYFCCTTPALSQVLNSISAAIMTDSPAVRIPLDPKEQPILDKLLAVRTNLELLKQDRSTYVKSQDIIELYDQVIEQVGALNQIRTTKRLEQNRGSLPTWWRLE